MAETELFDFMLGSRLGYGAYRDVFEFKFNQKYVVKVAIEDSGRQANLLEEKVWREIDMTPVAKWFAPVVRVSGQGKYLIQERIEPLPKAQYPKEIPAFFTDTKYANFGWLEGKGFVCCDFGSFNIFRGVSTRLKKAEWWGDE